jgi:hypothetical protein
MQGWKTANSSKINPPCDNVQTLITSGQGALSAIGNDYFRIFIPYPLYSFSLTLS